MGALLYWKGCRYPWTGVRMMDHLSKKWPYNTARWARLRLVKLAHDPLCYSCDLRGRIIVADTVDHVTPIRSGGDAYPPLAGLMSLCHSCHSQKTQAVDRHDRWGNGRRFAGIDLDGNPVDPSDGWHGGEGRVGNQKVADSEPMMTTQIDLFSDTFANKGL